MSNSSSSIGGGGAERTPDLMDSGMNLKSIGGKRMGRELTSITARSGSDEVMISDQGFEGGDYQMEVGDHTLYNKENCDEILSTLPAPVAQPLITETGSFKPEGFVPVRELVEPGTLPKSMDPHFVPRAEKAKNFARSSILPFMQDLASVVATFLVESITKQTMLSLYLEQRQQEEQSRGSESQLQNNSTYSRTSWKFIFTSFAMQGLKAVQRHRSWSRSLFQRFCTSILLKPVLKTVVAEPISYGFSYGLLTALGLRKVNPGLVPLLARGIYFIVDFGVENFCELSLMRCSTKAASMEGLLSAPRELLSEMKNCILEPFSSIRTRTRQVDGRREEETTTEEGDTVPHEVIIFKTALAASSFFDGLTYHLVKELATGSLGLSFCQNIGLFPTLKYGSVLSYSRYFIVSSCWSALFHPLGTYALKVGVLDKLSRSRGTTADDNENSSASSTTIKRRGSDRNQNSATTEERNETGGEDSGAQQPRSTSSVDLENGRDSLLLTSRLTRWYLRSPAAWVGFDVHLYRTAWVFVKVYMTD